MRLELEWDLRFTYIISVHHHLKANWHSMSNVWFTIFDLKLRRRIRCIKKHLTRSNGKWIYTLMPAGHVYLQLPSIGVNHQNMNTRKQRESNESKGIQNPWTWLHNKLTLTYFYGLFTIWTFLMQGELLKNVYSNCLCQNHGYFLIIGSSISHLSDRSKPYLLGLLCYWQILQVSSKLLY